MRLTLAPTPKTNLLRVALGTSPHYPRPLSFSFCIPSHPLSLFHSSIHIFTSSLILLAIAISFAHISRKLCARYPKSTTSFSVANNHTMAFKQEEPPAYGPPPGAPQPTYGGYQQDPYGQQQGQFQQGGQQQGYYQQGPPQMGYYNQQQGPFPAGQGPYPPQQGPYGQPPPQGYYSQDDQRGGGGAGGGIMTGLLAGLACCCCLDCLF